VSRRQKDPLRALTDTEQLALARLSRAHREPASQVIRAKLVRAVAAGQSYTAAAQGVRRRSGDAVATRVACFNREGLAAIVPGHGGGTPAVYGAQERERILTEAHRTPDAARDGTTTWSLATLRHALRTAPDGFPRVSTATIWQTLRAAGLHWQQSRTWCETGSVLRQRTPGAVRVLDPDAAAKKS